MAAPDRIEMSFAMERTADGWMATAIRRGQPGDSIASVAPHTRSDENPFEAAWNAVAGVLTTMGYDTEEER